MSGLKAQKKQEKGDTTTQTLTLVECGREARQKLITSHLPLAVFLARYFYKTNKRHVDFEDLVGAANEGLTEALDRFNPKMGYRFSTYAAWWIKNRIKEQIKQNRWTMRIPDRTYRMVIKLLRFRANFEQQQGQEPTLEETAAGLGVTPKAAMALQAWVEGEAISLDIPVGDDGDSTLVDLLADPRTFSPDETQEFLELQEAARRVIATLRPREERVLRMLLGLGERWDHTIREMAQKFGVSDERIQQILRASIRKLRHPSRSQKLKVFVEA